MGDVLLVGRGFRPRRLPRLGGFGHHGLWRGAGGHPWIVLIVIAVVVIAFLIYRRRR